MDLFSHGRSAEIVKHYERQPDQRVVDNVDEDGNDTKIEVRQVLDNIERNVDLPATEAGGRPKDEDHMSEKERKLRVSNRRENREDEGANSKSIDRPQEKMVSKPQAKK